MRKATLMGAILGGMLAFAGPASATDYVVNMYGASAQYIFWKTAMPNYLSVDKGCTSVVQKTDVSNQYYARGTSCTNGHTYTLRYASKASYDGIEALTGHVFPGESSGCPDDHMRKFLVDHTSSTLDCFKVNVAASDVEAKSFVQQSPARSFSSGIPLPGNTFTAKPMVVPFGFFVTPDVTVSTCSDGIYKGEQCETTADCPITGGGTGACVAEPIDSVSRLQVQMIFSGGALFWNDFGKGYGSSATDNAIKVCLREAGSGTHATLDLGIMKAKGWNGGPLATSNTTGNMFFNQSSSNMVSCIRGSSGTQKGAIGYMDADQAICMDPLYTLAAPTTTTCSSKLTNIRAIKYNGVAPTRRAIRNGEYDNFWSSQVMYADRGAPEWATIGSLVQNLATVAGNPEKLNTLDRSQFWASNCEMVYMKTSDKEYPSYVGASCTSVQTP
ncbi:MAG: substrate-binding domain-containing protein [Syntrophobacteraceae bacterium]